MYNTILFLTIICIIFTVSPEANSQDNFNVIKIGSYLSGRDVQDVVISGDYAFCADVYGLSVWDLSEPENPIEIARRPTPGRALSLDIHGNYVYVGDYWEGLSIFDVSDPTHPQLVNEVEIRYREAWATYRLKVYIHDETLYYLSSVLGLFVFSLEHPDDPELIDTYSEETYFADIDVRENLAYISCYNPDYILILNIVHPEELEVVNRIELDFPPSSCDIQGDILAIVDLNNHGYLFIYSLEDPISPDLQGQCEVQRAGSVWIDDDYVYVLSYMGVAGLDREKFFIIEIGNLEDPRIVGFITPHEGGALAIHGDYAYTASYRQGLRAISIENPEEPELVNDPLEDHSYMSIYIEEGTSFVQDYAQGLDIIDVDSPSNPTLISEWLRDDRERRNFIMKSTIKYDDYVYTGAFRSLSVIDVEDVNNPELVIDFYLFDWGFNIVNKMYLLDDYLYITGRFRDPDDVNDFMNLFVFNIENPGQPEVAFQRRELAFGMGYSSLDNNILYQVAKVDPGSGDHYVLVYDVEDPSRPRYRGRWRGGSYETMLVHNQVAYIYFDDAINIFTVEDPMEPDQVGSMQIDREITDMCIDGEVIYLSADKFGFYCMSIENPTDPEIVGYYDTPGTVYECQGSDGYLYVCDDFELGIYDCAEIHGIWDLHVSAESHDFGEVHLNTDSTWQLTISNTAQQPVDILDISSDSVAFTVDFDNTLTIDPDEEAAVEVTFTPTEQRPYTGELTINTERRDLVVSLSGTGADLSIAEDELQPLEFGLKPACPNPFNSVTTVRYDIARNTHLNLSVYDINGRLVESLFAGTAILGSHCLTWDASRLSSGLYLIRMDVGERHYYTKVALVK